jgi:hypothetical protein
MELFCIMNMVADTNVNIHITLQQKGQCHWISKNKICSSHSQSVWFHRPEVGPRSLNSTHTHMCAFKWLWQWWSTHHFRRKSLEWNIWNMLYSKRLEYGTVNNCLIWGTVMICDIPRNINWNPDPLVTERDIEWVHQVGQ